ncbi:MAG: PD40 domain-containing protein, partial [Caldilineaceae bacterium]|nr:PD40 domain-containing protein [Caldilineaceae bacterium]
MPQVTGTSNQDGHWSPGQVGACPESERPAARADTRHTQIAWCENIRDRKSTRLGKECNIDPVFSPDGRYLAWTSMEQAGYEADRARLMMLDTRTNN